MAHITIYDKNTGSVLRYASVPDGEEEAQLQNENEAFQVTGTFGNFAMAGPQKPADPDVETAVA